MAMSFSVLSSVELYKMTSVSCDVCFESCRITCRVKLLCPNHKRIAIKISVVLLGSLQDVCLF